MAMKHIPRVILIPVLCVTLVALILVVPVVRSLITSAWDLVQREIGRQREAREIEAFHRPPPDLPSRSGDFDRFPRKGFGFVYQTGYGTRIDTFEGLVTKDLISARDTTIKLALTEAEMDTIYRKAIQIRLFEYPEPHPPIDGRTMVEPSTVVTFRVTAGAVEKEFSWDTGWVNRNTITYDWKRLWELLTMIHAMIERKPEYKALPEARGGYY